MTHGKMLGCQPGAQGEGREFEKKAPGGGGSVLVDDPLEPPK